MGDMPKVPDSTKSSLAYKISARARERWPQLASVEVTHRAGFAYITGTLPDGEPLQLCRLRYGGSASIAAPGDCQRGISDQSQLSSSLPGRRTHQRVDSKPAV